MLTVRATIKDNFVEFLDEIELPDGGEQSILITFLDKNVTEFEGLNQSDVLKLVSTSRFKLSEREIDVLRLVKQGLTNEQIAEKLEIGHGTARNYLSSVYEKLEVENRTGAIAKASELGLLD